MSSVYQRLDFTIGGVVLSAFYITLGSLLLTSKSP